MAITPLDEFDYTSEMLYPHLTIPDGNAREELMLAGRIRNRPRDETLLLAPTALRFAAVVAGLTHEQIEVIMRLGSLRQKQALVASFNITEHLAKIEELSRALARELGHDPQEADHELARTRLYLNDHRLVFGQPPQQP